MDVIVRDYWFGTIRRTRDGVGVAFDCILASPGDWPDIREALPDGDRWSTIRFGVQLLATSPFRIDSPGAGGRRLLTPGRPA